MFQSLSRDSGRLNLGGPCVSSVWGLPVSIPQSGFGAFEPSGRGPTGFLQRLFQSLSRDSGRLNLGIPTGNQDPMTCFNPSVGIRGV